jgi:hypothetical protein
MFNLKEILDGLIETILDFPIMFLRTQALLATHGPIGPYLVARRARAKNSPYLRLRTSAFIQIVILYVVYGVVGASNSSAGLRKFMEDVLAGIWKLPDTAVSDATFVDFLGFFLTLYYSYYLVVLLLRFRGIRATVLVNACLFYATFSIATAGVFGLVLIGAINQIFSTTNEILIRTALVASYLYAFGKLGVLLSASSKWHGLRRHAGPFLFGGMCFAVFIAIIWLFLGKDGVWPNLNI